MHFNTPSAKWRPFGSGLNVFTKPCRVPYACHPAQVWCRSGAWRLPGAKSVWGTPSHATYQLHAFNIWIQAKIIILIIADWPNLVYTEPKHHDLLNSVAGFNSFGDVYMFVFNIYVRILDCGRDYISQLGINTSKSGEHGMFIYKIRFCWPSTHETTPAFNMYIKWNYHKI